MAQNLYGWNGILSRPPLFGLTGDLSSRGVAIPKTMDTMTVYSPQLKAATTFKIETLTPPLADDQTEVWTTANWVNDDGAGGLPVVNALTGLGSTSAPLTLVFRSHHVGAAGVVRFTVSAAQDTQVQFVVIFGLGD